MARKSRKENDKYKTPHIEPVLVQVAAYVRLSQDDRLKKGHSIESQKSIISDYIAEHPELELYDTYIDENVSGTTFERSAFQRMMRDAESGKIRCIVVKDMSRFGRNMIDSGYYIEVVFPKLGIRLISITDNYDTDSYEGGVALPLANLMNEVYALDIGRKRRSQARQAMHDGVYVGGHPPYGYLRSSDDRRKLIVDGDAASVVKRIFEFAAIGVSSYEIACKLNTMKISPPAVHKNIQCPGSETSSAGHWYARTIDKFLKTKYTWVI